MVYADFHHLTGHYPPRKPVRFTQRLLEPLGYVPPAEYEASYYAQAKVA